MEAKRTIALNFTGSNRERKSAISPAVDVGHGRQWCHWNRHEKLHP
jgi:hypothetical protein